MFIVFGQTGHQNRRSAVIHQNKKTQFSLLTLSTSKTAPSYYFSLCAWRPEPPTPRAEWWRCHGNRGEGPKFRAAGNPSHLSSDEAAAAASWCEMNAEVINEPNLLSPAHLMHEPTTPFQTDTTRFPSGCTNHSQWKGKKKQNKSQHFLESVFSQCGAYSAI